MLLFPLSSASRERAWELPLRHHDNLRGATTVTSLWVYRRGAERHSSPTLPKTTWRSSSQLAFAVVTKNWQPFVFGPLFAMDNSPGPARSSTATEGGGQFVAESHKKRKTELGAHPCTCQERANTTKRGDKASYERITRRKQIASAVGGVAALASASTRCIRAWSLLVTGTPIVFRRRSGCLQY